MQQSEVDSCEVDSVVLSHCSGAKLTQLSQAAGSCSSDNGSGAEDEGMNEVQAIL